MNREILFRGKVELPSNWRGYQTSYRNGDWIYGLMDSIESIRRIPVCTNTIGQYTGLTDKNDTKIFEGDICRFYGGEYYAGYWEVDHICAIEINYECLWYLENAENVEIIGNIYDNSKLLGGNKNE